MFFIICRFSFTLNVPLKCPAGYDVPAINIEIISLNGQLQLSKEMEGTIHQIDLSSFQTGIYYISIRSEDFVTTKKIVKL